MKEFEHRSKNVIPTLLLSEQKWNGVGYKCQLLRYWNNSEVVMEKMKFWHNWKLFDSWSEMLPKADISFTLVFEVFIGLMNLDGMKCWDFFIFLLNYHIVEKNIYLNFIILLIWNRIRDAILGHQIFTVVLQTLFSTKCVSLFKEWITRLEWYLCHLYRQSTSCISFLSAVILYYCVRLVCCCSHHLSAEAQKGIVMT